MKEQAWRERLKAAVEDSGKSKRKISLDAGLGAGYVHSILTEGKDPTVENMLAVTRSIGVSFSYIMFGTNVGPVEEEVLTLLGEMPVEDRKAVLQILKRKAGVSNEERP